MDRAVYDRMWAQEEDHWWFSGRRAIISEIVRRFGHLPDRPRLLEAGCGSGGNLAVLSQFGALDAFEFDAEAGQRAAERSGLEIPFGALPDAVPFDGTRYDLIGLFDVLEHIEDDEAALRALKDRLNGSGRIVVTVPAFQWLWSQHDVRHHHFRRYSKARMARVAERAGLQVERAFYFNTLLFPVAVATRAMKAVTRSDAPDDVTPSPAVNAALTRIFGFERHIVGRLPMPVGLSLGAVLTR